MDEYKGMTPTRAGFAARLGELRLAAGKPSYEALSRRSVFLHRSTIGDALRGRTLPSLELVRDFVDACARHAARLGITIDPGLVDHDRWVALWREVQGTASNPPSGEVVSASQWPEPRQLPPAGGLLIGRDRELAELDAMTPGSIALVSGMGGVGKSALIAHWARRRRDRHPNGELWLDMRAHARTEPLDPATALTGMLRALGLAPTTLPRDLSELSALFRSTLALRRILVVVDNAAAENVRALLPVRPECTTIVISRDRMPGLIALDGAAEMRLEPLSGPISAQLLDELVKTAVGSGLDPDVATELSTLCGGLPLALRVVGERLRWESPEQVRHDLRGEHGRLAALSLPDDPGASIDLVLASSIDRLPETAARMLCLLTLHPGPVCPLAAAAALADLPLYETQQDLGRLVCSSLVEVTEPGRYRLHDLVRLAAAERMAGAAERAPAVARLITWHRHTTAVAVRTVYPGLNFQAAPPSPPVSDGAASFEGVAQASEWFEAELDALPELVELAIAEGHPAAAAWMVVEFTVHFIKALPYQASLALIDRALEAAAQSPDGDRARSMATTSRALLLGRLGRHQEAREITALNTELFRKLGDTRHVVLNLVNLGMSWLDDDNAERAGAAFAEGRAEIGDHDWPYETAWIDIGQAEIKRRNGGCAEAERTARRALGVLRGLHDVSGQAFALRVVGRSLAGQGRTVEAVRVGEEAVALTAGTNDHFVTAASLTVLADVYDRAGDPVAARAARDRARRLITT